MPELPEVETIRLKLWPLLVGRRIVRARVLRKDIVGFPAARGFESGVAGRTITELRRRGKYLIVGLDRGGELVFHLRLSGHLAVVDRDRKVEYERARFELTGDKALSFAEPRALGRVYLVQASRYPKALAGMLKMGLEPIHDDFDAAYLHDRLRGRTASVKSLLLDQRVACGVGNIYSDEALFRAGIRPLRRAGSLEKAEVVRLARVLAEVLRDGIKWCGTTMGDGRYRLPDGGTGSFQKRLAVFGREGERCQRRGCAGEIRRQKLGGRSTHFCPVCQR
ncbi:MAG: bifunctional DNA-formamidopyrimidine glycosylase/DNA-(apurinic or apyrimidinic site) lyase [candidate division WOR-3 bacterium]|nr:bifunctional DNA-formamidopyrimidine glycosylase/DNA-(apurinic or apyrimidinic site) lyase [candidate division WOR-3 bacterium]